MSAIPLNAEIAECAKTTDRISVGVMADVRYAAHFGLMSDAAFTWSIQKPAMSLVAIQTRNPVDLLAQIRGSSVVGVD
jgi:hypothetical protein